ncbi:MAG: neutral zinc metallopeptidase [Solirubrobacterales bacterium]|nr:neutral zinc metallopeptidase [Solirubrobacterales bacterium]
MKWKRGAKSRDVIDIRGASKRSSGGGSGLPIPGGIGSIGGGAGLIVILVVLGISLLGGEEEGGFELPGAFGTGATAPGAERPQPLPPGQDPQADLKDFSAYVFDDAQDVWAATFRDGGRRWEDAQLVLYSGAVQTGGCGGASSAVGPFYCPADQRVYIDLSFYEDMRRRLGASGDFAWAYVIAHEMGHHVQRLTGTSSEVDRLSRSDPGDANELSVRQELQADCYAGVWASTVFAAGDLEAGDLEEAFGAAEAVGDDRLQERATGRVDPDSFTHGTSEQRRSWFDRGYRSGDPTTCDTFGVAEL